VLTLASGCVIIPQGLGYRGPEPRPDQLDQYYDHSTSFTSFRDEIKRDKKRYTQRRIRLETIYGPITLDYFQRHSLTQDVILIFPILGGKNTFENYFAQYFMDHGYDTVIVHRSNEFKKPENFDRIEEILRITLIRDRITLDFLERTLGKKNFGSFGLSRGAINAAMLAGVDDRLKYNVLIMGASNIAEVFKHSTQPGLQKFKKKVLALNNLTEDQFFAHLEETVLTDPKLVATYIDARNTLMFLSVFDTTVPFKYGLELRRQIGRPETVFLLSNHYTSLLYTQFFRVVLPFESIWPLPLDYVENESFNFYQRHFGKQRGVKLRELPLRIIRFPFLLIGRLLGAAF